MILQERLSGFTLVELIAIIVLLSILGIVALSRIGDNSDFESRAFFDDTLHALQYAQKLAVSTGCNVEVTLSSNGYQLQQAATRASCLSGPYTLNVADPADRTSPYQRNDPAMSVSPTQTFVFLPQSGTSLGANLDVTVNGRQFRVNSNSGLVHVL